MMQTELLYTLLAALLGIATGIFVVLSLIEKPIWPMMWAPRTPEVSDESARRVHEWHLKNSDGKSVKLVSKPMCTVGDPTVALGIIRAGSGVALLPAAFGEPRVESGEFLCALPGFAGPSVEIFASFPPRRASVPAVRAFLDILLEVGKDVPH